VNKKNYNIKMHGLYVKMG